MKSLGRTIDRIIGIDPSLEDRLVPIKNKWKRNPSRTTFYWKELLGFLNSDPLMRHPKRTEISKIVSETRMAAKPLYTFEQALPTDVVTGVLPEDIADGLRRHDRSIVRLSKSQLEANMTKNVALAAKLARQEALIDMNAKRLWFRIKDHFNLWERAASFTIKRTVNDMLVLVEAPPPQSRSMFVPMDPRNFFKMLGMDPENPQQSE